MSIELADILRKLAIGQGGMVAIFAIWAVVRYAKKLIKVPPTERALPMHVATIGLSYLLLVAYVGVSIYEKMDEPPTWRIPTALCSFTLGLAALTFMFAHLSARRLLRETFAKKVEAEANKEIQRQLERTEHRMQRMEEVGQHAHDTIQEIKEDNAAARTELAQTLEKVERKADAAYHEANEVNTKILGTNTTVAQQLDHIQDHTETARIKTSDVSDKADVIGNIAQDTNTRVRNIETGNGGK